MNEGFVKLFTSILDSSVWNYDAETKVVWVTLLAMADKDGLVHAAVTGIAARAGVSIEKAEEALNVFSKPDKYSRNTEHDGIRIEKIGRDWNILNFQDFQNEKRREVERARKRKWWRENRSKEAWAKKAVEK